MTEFRTADPEIIERILKGAEKKGRVEAKETLTTMDGAEIGSFLISDETGENAVMIFRDTEGSCIKTESGDPETVLAKKNEFKAVTQGVAEIMQGKKPAAIPAVVYADGDAVPLTVLIPDGNQISGELSADDYIRDNKYMDIWQLDAVPVSRFYDFAWTVTGDAVMDCHPTLTTPYSSQMPSNTYSADGNRREFITAGGKPAIIFRSASDLGTGTYTLTATPYLHFRVSGQIKNSSNALIPATVTLTNTVTAEVKTVNSADGGYLFEFEAATETEAWVLKAEADGYASNEFPAIAQNQMEVAEGLTRNFTLSALAMNISGTVTDGTDPIDIASVQLIDNADDSVISQTSTNTSGAYSFSNIAYTISDSFRIEISKTGFDVLTSDSITPEASLILNYQLTAQTQTADVFPYMLQMLIKDGRADINPRIIDTYDASDSPVLYVQTDQGNFSYQSIQKNRGNYADGWISDGNSAKFGGENECILYFEDVTIPGNAVVSNAYVSMKAGGYFNAVESIDCQISFMNPNSYLPDNESEFDAVSANTAVPWTSTADWTDNTRYNTPDISAALQAAIANQTEIISLTVNDPAYNSAENILAISESQSQLAHLYSFDAVAGTSYKIETYGSTDTIAELWTADGSARPGENDDSGTGSNALINWTCTESGTYIIKITGWGDGPYSLDVVTV